MIAALRRVAAWCDQNPLTLWFSVSLTLIAGTVLALVVFGVPVQTVRCIP